MGKNKEPEETFYLSVEAPKGASPKDIRAWAERVAQDLVKAESLQFVPVGEGDPPVEQSLRLRARATEWEEGRAALLFLIRCPGKGVSEHPPVPPEEVGEQQAAEAVEYRRQG